MPQYLLAAEADKIQDLIFRASRLREVVGGSQLLTRFCEEVPPKILPDSAQVLVNDGGSFRIVFSSQEEAEDFGAQLAEIYRLATGGTMAVALPVEVDGDFKAAAERANEALREAKHHQSGFTMTPHLPYVAFCGSCGVGVAVEYSPRPGETRGQYLCADCRAKRDESDPASVREPGQFLSDFFEEVVGKQWKEWHWPGKARKGEEDREPDPPMDVARFDPRDYVAYLVADGNSMGEIFGRCDEKQLKNLSDGLRPAIYSSLAAPAKLLKRRAEDKKQPRFIPVLPLIAGGDDLFVLLPAPWALDMARRFAESYEENMLQLTEQLQLANIGPPTIAVAIVVCKAKYPYYLAHKRGEELLKQAKQITKRWAQEQQTTPRSIVGFDVILGNRLSGPEYTGTYRPTLGPFWIGDDVPGWGITLDRLIEHRYALHELPRRRLAQLRAHFEALTGVDKSSRDAWSDTLMKLLKRIAHSRDQVQVVSSALEMLGGEALYRVGRATDKQTWHGHALPDLLDAWDFAFDLGCKRTDYEE